MSNSVARVNDISLKEAFDIYQKQSDSLHKIWAYFQVVSIAVLGYTVGSEKAHWSVWTYSLISISYGFFAMSNHYVLALSQKELNRYANAVQDAAFEAGPIGRQLSVNAVKVVRVRMFHFVATLVVIGAIWGAWFDKCTGLKSCPTQNQSKSQ
jgi:hypothetical protein